MSFFSPQKWHQQHVRATACCVTAESPCALPGLCPHPAVSQSSSGNAPNLGSAPSSAASTFSTPRQQKNPKRAQGTGKAAKPTLRWKVFGGHRGFGEGDAPRGSRRRMGIVPFVLSQWKIPIPKRPPDPKCPFPSWHCLWDEQELGFPAVPPNQAGVCPSFTHPQLPEGDFSFPEGQTASGNIWKCPHGVRAW